MLRHHCTFRRWWSSNSRYVTTAVVTSLLGVAVLDTDSHDHVIRDKPFFRNFTCCDSSSAAAPPQSSSGDEISTTQLSSGNEKVYTREEVLKMDGSDEKPFWVTFRGEVYDLTRFKTVHPGGSLIEQTAGSDVEPFWNKWAIHFESKKVKAILDECKIGSLDVCHLLDRNTDYSNDPPRDPQRVYHDFCCTTPAASQTHPHTLEKSFLTPNEALYIRSHAPVPYHLSADTHEIVFRHPTNCSSVSKVKATLSLSELRNQFPSTNIISVLQCAGNRQIDDFHKHGVNGFTGTPFQTLKAGMIGNTLWTGLRLDTVLSTLYPKECAEEISSPGTWHVIFTGADEYESSTPLSLVLQAATDGILAFAMNGEALLPDHGYPLRVLLPGIAGARSVKWLEGITLSRSPSNAPWNAHYYRDYKGDHIQKLPLNSIIFSPEPHDVVQLSEDGSGSVSVQGVAYSGGNNSSICAVEVSADDGRSWMRARLLTEERVDNEQKFRTSAVGDHSWTRFVAEVPIKVDIDTALKSENGTTSVTVYSRGIDSLGNVQPELSSRGQRSFLYDGWGTATLSAIAPPRE